MKRDYKRFSISIKERIAVLRITRIKKKNAIDTIMINEISDICRFLNNDENIGAVIIIGSADIFSSGGDIGDWGSLSTNDFVNSWLREGNLAFDALAGLKQPVIAVLNGPTLGGGLELAACADYRIGEVGCEIGQPETLLGVIPGWSGTQRLRHRFGGQIVRRMAIFGEIFSAEDSFTLGLIDQIEETGDGLNAAISLAKRILKRGQLATQVTKMLINYDEQDGRSKTLEMLAGQLIHPGDEVREGVQAFSEKRPPNHNKT